MSYPCDPYRWVGVAMIASYWNAPGELIAAIAGVDGAAIQVVHGTTSPAPATPAGTPALPDYLESLKRNGLRPVGWGWCAATTVEAAAIEGRRHAEVALELELDDFMPNMEAEYDAYSNQASPKFLMPDAYLDAFRAVAPDVELAVTTTPRWASNHEALREAGAVLMAQAFPLDNGHSIADVVEFGELWGWDRDRLRPCVQVFKTRDELPPSSQYLADCEACEVGVVPYPVEQAFDEAGSRLLAELEPAIVRPPASAIEPPPNPNGGTTPMPEAEPLPPGAFDDCAKYETQTMKRPDGKDASAFTDRATSLKATRARVLELEQRIIALEQKP